MRAGTHAPHGRRGASILMLLGNNRFPHDPRVRREALALAEAGYDVTVVCRRDEGQPKRELVDGVQVRRYWNPLRPQRAAGVAFEWLWSAAACTSHMLRLVVRQGIDVVHAHNPPDTLVIAGVLARLLGKRYVFDHHDLSPEMYDAQAGGRGNPLVLGALRFLERASFRVASQVISTNESYARVAVERGGVQPERVAVVRNGPDPETSTPVAADSTLRARAETIIGYLGVIGPQDGVDHLIRAVAHLVHDYGRQSVLCVVVGRGESVPALERLAAELGVERYVWFTGHLREAEFAPILCAADVCVCPDPSNSYNDRSTMLKVMDYMALGRPVVAFDLPENRVTAGPAAVFVTPGDDAALARAIDSLMGDPERRRALGALGRRRVEEALGWSRSATRLLDVYERLLPPPADDAPPGSARHLAAVSPRSGGGIR